MLDTFSDYLDSKGIRLYHLGRLATVLDRSRKRRSVQHHQDAKGEPRERVRLLTVMR